MRILLALDGSAGADVARELVTTLPWPEGSHVEAVRVVEPVYDVFAMPGVVFEGPIDEVLGLAEVRRLVDQDAATLAAAGLEVSSAVIVGRPATAIVERARTSGADLVVLGSRGRGPIASMLLGSVSGEVTVHAPCPVLVARTPTIERVMLAFDGTPEADRVVAAVGRLGFLARAQVEVVSVAPSIVPGPAVMLSGGYAMPLAWYEESVAAARGALEQGAKHAATTLAAGGLTTSWAVHDGDPAARIIEVAREDATDLIIVGTHGRTGLSRLLLGSVAHNVLVHAHASVLVVREPDATAEAD